MILWMILILMCIRSNLGVLRQDDLEEIKLILDKSTRKLQIETNAKIQRLETRLEIAIQDSYNVKVKLVESESKLIYTEDKLKACEATVDQRVNESVADTISVIKDLVGSAIKDREIESYIQPDLLLKDNNTAFVRKQEIMRDTPLLLPLSTALPTSINPLTEGIAFYAWLTHSLTGLGKQNTIVFDHVETNVGAGYDAKIGIFHCPLTGVYVFSTATMTTRYNLTELEIVIDGHIKARTLSAGSTSNHGFDQGFNTAILQCNEGQQVWVRVNGQVGSTLYASQFSTFSGYLLWRS